MNVAKKTWRNALSLSPFTFDQFSRGYIYQAGKLTAKTPEELQELYRAAGSTEMFVRIGTKRKRTVLESDAQDTNADIHTLEDGLMHCRIAAKLGIPMNPEIMCAYTYMDVGEQQAPDFHEYPEFFELQKGKPWEKLTLEEMATVLKAYGDWIGGQIAATGCIVEHINLGNEANFGFAGFSLGLKNAVDTKLTSVTGMHSYILSALNPGWLKKHLWEKQAYLLCALRDGLKKWFPNAAYGTHISLLDVKSAMMQFDTLQKNGYDMDDPGISFYPSNPSRYKDRLKQLSSTVLQINEHTGKKVFVAEFAYPSIEKMGAPYENWTNPVKDYPLTEAGQRKMYEYLQDWGKDHGLSGIRYWGPDFTPWEPMALFNFDEQAKTAHAKELLENLLKN